jgi:PKD repeat protein
MYIIIKDLSFIGIIVSVLALASSCKKEKSVFAVADFTYSGRTDTVPTTIQFINKSYGLTYSWDFGDGSSSTDKNPNHTFNQVGTYNVKLIAKGTNNSDTMEIVIGIGDIIPRDGLVGWWPFNGNADDESGNGNHGFNITAQSIVDRFGRLNSAYQLGNGVIQLPSIVFQFSRNSSFTVSLWFTHEATGNARLISTENNEGNFRIANASLSTIHGDFATQFGDYLFDTLTNPNQWNHLVYTYSNRNEKTYINGNLTNINYDIDNELLNYGSPLCIGAKASAIGNDRWNGKFDDFGIWNRVLTQQEITNLYNGGR